MPVRACRGCLATEPKLYNIYKNNLYEVFGEVIGNPIFESDDLPQHICAMCYAQLMKYVSFRGRCLLVQDLLEDLKLQGIKVTTSFIRKIDRNKCNLLPNLKQSLNLPTTDLIIQEEVPCEPVPPSQEDTELNHKPVEPSAQSSSSLISQKEIQDTPLSSTQDDWPEEPLSPQSPYEVTSEELPKSILTDIQMKSLSILDGMAIEEFKNKYNMDVKFLTKEERIEDMKKKILKLSSSEDHRPFCSDCGKRATSEIGLELHKISCHDNAVGPNQCEVCKCRFKSRQFYNHACNKITFKCNKCNQSFKSVRTVKSHARKHLNDDISTNDDNIISKLSKEGKNYYCKHCTSGFVTYDLMRSHVQSKHSDKMLWCKCCGESFINMAGLKNHMFKIHAKKLEHGCQKCNIKFKTSEALEKHSSLTCENFNCVMCGEHFESELVLKDHVVKEHSRSEYIKLACCDGCGVKFYGTDPLVKHLEQKCCGSGHPCLICGQNFPSSQSLYSHQSEYHILYRACESCDKAFDPHNYRHHMSRVHNLAPPKHHQGMYENTATKLWSVHGSIIKGEEIVPTKFSEEQAREGHLMCQYCGKTFKKIGYLMHHTQRHTGEKPYVCATCGHGFVRKDQLANHVRLHTGEMPFACHICPKRFRIRHAFKRHLLCHSETRRHVCHECGKSFRTSTSVKIHIRGVHLNIPTRGPRKREYLALNSLNRENFTLNQQDNLQTQSSFYGENVLSDKNLTQPNAPPEEPMNGHIQGLMDKDITQGGMVYGTDSVTDTAVPRVIKTIHLKRKRKPMNSTPTSDFKDGGTLTQDCMDSEVHGRNIAPTESKIRKKNIKKPRIANKIKKLKVMDNNFTQNVMDMDTQGFTNDDLSQDFKDQTITHDFMDSNIKQENIVYGTLSRTIPVTAIKKSINTNRKKLAGKSMPFLDFISETQPQDHMDTHGQVNMAGPSGYNLENKQGFMDTGISIQDGAANEIILSQQDFRGGDKKYVIIASAAKNAIVKRNDDIDW